MKGEKTLALFKIFKGKKINLPKTYNEGYCYFTEDDGKFYIDTTSNASGRKCLNAGHADSADTAAKADFANSATNATNAGHAESANSATEATSASKLKTDAGSATNLVYFKDGVPVVGTYSLNKTVPSDAVFTDTTYKVVTTDTNGLISSEMYNKLVGIYKDANKVEITADYTSGTKIGSVKTNDGTPVNLYIPTDKNDNDKVKSEIVSADSKYAILLNKNGLTGSTDSAYINSGIYVNPSTKTITATTFAGNATSATRATTAESADAVAWNNVSGKPDSFTPSAHDHERIKLKDATSVSNFPYQSDFLVAYKQEDDILDIGLRTSFGLLFQDSSLRKQKFGLRFSGQNDIQYFYSREENGEIAEYYYTLATENDVNSAREYADNVLQGHKREENPHNITLSTFSVTATKDELNVLDGITATTQELNYTDGVTSNIQTQLNGKAASSHTHSNYASSVTTTGSGNAITAISQSGNTITATKGNTFALSNHTHNYAPIVDGLIPSTYLPSYVDDVIEGYYNGTSFYKNKSGTTYSNQITGETGKIYTDLSTEKIYRWSGSKFVVISETLALGETSSTAYAGNKGKANADAITALQTGKADANHTHNVYVNQNAFSNIKINSDTIPIAATSTTDTFNLIAGDNVTITSNEKNITISSKVHNYDLSAVESSGKKTYLQLTPNFGYQSGVYIEGAGATTVTVQSNECIVINSTDTNTTYSAGTGISITGTANTITNTGVRSITSGSTNGTINVNTNGTTADVKVKGLGSAAYTDSSAYQSAITGAASTITGSNLTVNRTLVSDASGKVAVSSATSTELGYLSGVTSAIQTQLNGTVKTTGNQTISGIKTFSSGRLNGICFDAGTASLFINGDSGEVCFSVNGSETGTFGRIDIRNQCLIFTNLSCDTLTTSEMQLGTDGTILTDDAELITAYNALA